MSLTLLYMGGIGCHASGVQRMKTQPRDRVRSWDIIRPDVPVQHRLLGGLSGGHCSDSASASGIVVWVSTEGLGGFTGHGNFSSRRDLRKAMGSGLPVGGTLSIALAKWDTGLHTYGASPLGTDV